MLSVGPGVQPLSMKQSPQICSIHHTVKSWSFLPVYSGSGSPLLPGSHDAPGPLAFPGVLAAALGQAARHPAGLFLGSWPVVWVSEEVPQVLLSLEDRLSPSDHASHILCPFPRIQNEKGILPNSWPSPLGPGLFSFPGPLLDSDLLLPTTWAWGHVAFVPVLHLTLCHCF